MKHEKTTKTGFSETHESKTRKPRQTSKKQQKSKTMPEKRSYLANEASFREFKASIENKPRTYNSLSGLRSYLMKRDEMTPLLRKKIVFVQRKMTELVKEAGATQRRVPGTGERIEEQVEYKDTPENRKRGRVGQTYTRVTYKDAQFEEHKQRRPRRLKLKTIEPEVEGFTKPVRRNFWIEAMEIAKSELGAQSFVVVRKEVTDPNNEEQVFGHKVYLRAAEILQKLREEDAKNREKQAKEFEVLKQWYNPELVDAIASTTSSHKLRKIVMEHGPEAYQAVQGIKAGKKASDFKPKAGAKKPAAPAAEATDADEEPKKKRARKAPAAKKVKAEPVEAQ